MDPIFNVKIFRQDSQDSQDYFFLSQFPEETEKTQSDFVGREYLILTSKLPYWIDVTPSY
jgi:hypothetical protein